MPKEDPSTYKNIDSEAEETPPIWCLIQAAVAGDLLSGRERLIPLPEGKAILGRGALDAVSRQEGEAHVLVRDSWMSGRHVSLSATGEGLFVRDLGSTNGTRLHGEKIEEGLLTRGGYLEVGQTFFTCATLPPLPFSALDPSLKQELDAKGVRSLSPSFLQELAKVRQIAPSQVSVLILGESGTGKELIARELHEQSGRRGRLVAIHCGAIAESLLESELFGHKKGAFTGAVSQHEGFVLASDGGTLFLDEIGEMTPPAQVRLLRVLQEREVIAVGDTHPRKVDLRLVAATNRDLQALVAAGEFRGDLYSRLGGVRLSLPPLVERRCDLGLLTAHFLRKFAGEKAAACAPNLAALRLLFAYRWPFNIRELEKTIEGAVALSGKERPATPEDLPPELSEAPERPKEASPLSPEEEELKARLLHALKGQNGNVSAVAREWGKGRTQIHRWMKRFDIRA
jgi:transcriptional regulator with PAS, ATPase and Fis domain